MIPILLWFIQTFCKLANSPLYASLQWAETIRHQENQHKTQKELNLFVYLLVVFPGRVFVALSLVIVFLLHDLFCQVQASCTKDHYEFSRELKLSSNISDTAQWDDIELWRKVGRSAYKLNYCSVLYVLISHSTLSAADQNTSKLQSASWSDALWSKMQVGCRNCILMLHAML